MTSFLSGLFNPTEALFTQVEDSDLADAELRELLGLPSDEELAELADQFLL